MVKKSIHVVKNNSQQDQRNKILANTKENQWFAQEFHQRIKNFEIKKK